MVANISDQLQNINYNTAQVQFTNGQQNKGNGAITKEGFIQLMMAQMRNQNPLEPTDSTQQLQQQAALTQVDELQKLNTNLTQSAGITQASNFVGMNVTYNPGKDPITLQQLDPVNGKVDSALFTNEGVKLLIGGKQISPSQITEMKLPAATL